MSNNTIPFVVRISPELHAALKAAAETDERSMAQAIRIAIKRYAESVVGVREEE